MAEIAVEMAADPQYGYSQKPPGGRWGPDYDCASFLYEVADRAGFPVGTGPGKVRFTGQMTKDFKDAGFELLPFANVGLGDLQIGDILLNLALHAEIYVGEGQTVGAMASETGGYSGMPGDQTGTEIEKHPAYVYEKGWDYVLRAPSDEDDEAYSGADEPAEEEGDEQEMAYPYSNYTSAYNSAWQPNSGLSGMPRTTGPQGWMPPMYGNGGYPQGGYSQGNVGQMNGYAQAGGYQQQYPQGNSPRQLTHVKDLNEVRDIHVAPGEAIVVFLGEGQHMAIKSADQEGFPSIRVFEIRECSEDMPQHNWMPGGEGGYSQPEQPRMQQTQGVSRQEFDQLKEMIANVQSAISSGFPQGNANPTVDASGNGANGNAKQANRSGRNA